MRTLWEVPLAFTPREVNSSDGFKLCNDYAPFYARRIMEREPDLAGFFTTRDQGERQHARKAAPGRKRNGQREERHLKSATVLTKTPRQTRLPGMEDSAIKDLEDAAIEHSELQAEMVAERAAMKDKIKVVDAKIMRLMKEAGKEKLTTALASL